MFQPLISIIIPCYNQELYLSECLQSVLHQIYTNWECLVIDDGSTDDSETIALKYVEKDPRFTYYKTKNGGPSQARNFGLRECKGNLILFLDGDDLLHKEKLSKSVAYLGENDMIISNFEMLSDGLIFPPFSDITKHEINLENIVSKWDIDFNIPIHCIIFKKELIKEIVFKEELKAKEDWIFWITLFNENNPSVSFVDEPLVIYRQHSKGISKNFVSVYNDNKTAHDFVFESFDERIKKLVFKKINTQNFILNNENLNQKIYIRQLQNTKILKYYLKIKSLWYHKK